MSNINAIEYCKNPQYYKNILTNSELDFFNATCTSIKNLEHACNDIKDMVVEEIKNAPEQLQKVLSFGLQFIEGILTPSGLATLAEFQLINLVLLNFQKNFRLYFKDILKENLETILKKDVFKLTDDLLFNTICFSKSFFDCLRVATGRPVMLALKGIGEATVRVADSIISLAIPVFDIFMNIGMLLDLWDPCGFNDQVGASVVNKMSDKFNEVFRNNQLKAFNSITLSDGSIIIKDEWPLEYTDDIHNYLTDDEKKFYNDKTIEYYLHYLNNLTVNSDGLPIRKDVNMGKLQNTSINKLDSFTKELIGNDNTVFNNWLFKYIPLIIIVIIIFIIIIFIIIK